VYAATRIVAGVSRPRSLTDAGIAAAALAIIERDGIAGLSMRAVATEMGVGTMSLYRYVDGRDQLEGLVIGLVLDAVDTRVPAGAPWEEQVTTRAGLGGRPRPPGRRAAAAHPAPRQRGHAAVG
jgi:AcrR family transcriptional regulator